FGDDILMLHYGYARSEPGHPGISLHADGQPYGSAIFGYEGSCPRLIRVLYYLDDLTPDVSPFRVVPRSHLSLHADANPYLRYKRHPDELMVTATAGSAVIIHHQVFHGNFPNTGARSREMLAIAYRAAWAGPAADVAEWKAEHVAATPPEVQPLLGSRNQRSGGYDAGNKPPGMPSDAPGISTSRWL
ncbi:MAG: phytanoyl-CoA dioxygenase family protein, partial [Pirellulaceae bacterium]|nr:phytanoyl-CoA dioxygenase family protein [Pirellulaceae bacterium]